VTDQKSGSWFLVNRDQSRIGAGKVGCELRPALRLPHHPWSTQLREHPDEYAIVTLIGPVIDGVQSVVEDWIETLGSIGPELRCNQVPSTDQEPRILAAWNGERSRYPSGPRSRSVR
jgi:hypothetical protein